MKLRFGSMQAKITAFVILTLVVGFGILVYMSTKKQASELMEASHAKTELLSASIISSMKSIMMTGKPESVSELVGDLRKVEGVGEIRVFGRDGAEVHMAAGSAPLDAEGARLVGQTVATGQPHRLQAGAALTLFRPLAAEERCAGCHVDEGNVLGVVSVSVPLDEVYAGIRKSRFMGLGNAALVILFVAFILSIEIESFVLRPVRRSVRVMEEMEKEKDLTRRMEHSSGDELGRLSKGFNSFVGSIQKVIQKINRVTYQVSTASTQIVVNSSRVMDGANIQARAVESTSGAVEEMNASMKEIAGSATILSTSAEETSSSIMEMVAAIDQIAGSTAVLSSSVDSTVSSITEISASIKEVATSVGALSDAVKTGEETMERITGLITRVEESARESSALTGRVAEQAKSLGSGAMARAIEGMDRIKKSVERSGEVIYRLGDRSKQIGDILNIIDEVADQTELLSLNAAILASQAGEHGKGFAVVAEEIKDLAERTVSSTSEITKLIATVQAEAQEAVEAMDNGRRAVEEGRAVVHEAREVLVRIVDASVKSSEMSREIESSTAQQSDGAARVGEVMSSISAMVKQIYRATRELTEGSEQILREADKVKDVARQVDIATREQSKGSEGMIKAIEGVHLQARQIASATSEHQKGSEDIARSIERIREVAQENESLSEEMSRAAEDLAMHTEELKDKVNSFNVTEAGTEMVKLGIVPLESPAQMYKKFYPLAEYLTRRVGREVVFKLTSTFADAVADIGKGAADICYMTPTTYIEAHDKFGVKLMVKAARKGSPYSHTIIVARADSGITSLEGLKGRSFAFGDPMSTSSYFVPLHMLKKAGVRLDDLSEHKFLGHHDDVAKAVLFGEFDAGGLRETTALQYKDKGLKFLKTSDAIPEFNFCMRPGLDADLASKIMKALMDLDAKDAEGARVLKAIDKDYTGFMEARDTDYTSVREIIKGLDG